MKSRDEMSDNYYYQTKREKQKSENPLGPIGPCGTQASHLGLSVADYVYLTMIMVGSIGVGLAFPLCLWVIFGSHP
jgi:hypothetical protein